MLHAVLLHREAELVAVHELPVDGPLPVQAVELESPRDPGGGSRIRQVVEVRLRCRIHTVICDIRARDLELHDQVPCASRLDSSRCPGTEGEALGALSGRAVLRTKCAVDSRRSLAVDLVQPVLKIQRLAGEIREVDDDIHALGGANTDACYLDGRRDEIAVCANQEERIGRRRTTAPYVTSQEELVEA